MAELSSADELMLCSYSWCSGLAASGAGGCAADSGGGGSGGGGARGVYVPEDSQN